jgi:integrase
VLPFLVRVLQAHRERSISKGEYIFSTATGKPFDLDNLRFRVIREELQQRESKSAMAAPISPWPGFEPVRLGIADKTIQAILRHANVTTTQASYIKTAPAEAHLAMQRLEQVLGAEWTTFWTTSSRGKAC